MLTVTDFIDILRHYYSQHQLKLQQQQQIQVPGGPATNNTNSSLDSKHLELDLGEQKISDWAGIVYELYNEKGMEDDECEKRRTYLNNLTALLILQPLSL